MSRIGMKRFWHGFAKQTPDSVNGSSDKTYVCGSHMLEHHLNTIFPVSCRVNHLFFHPHLIFDEKSGKLMLLSMTVKW